MSNRLPKDSVTLSVSLSSTGCGGDSSHSRHRESVRAATGLPITVIPRRPSWQAVSLQQPGLAPRDPRGAAHRRSCRSSLRTRRLVPGNRAAGDGAWVEPGRSSDPPRGAGSFTVATALKPTITGSFALVAALSTCVPALAQGSASAAPLAGWQAGAVLDIAAASRALSFGQRDKGLGLGHSDVSANGPLGRRLEAQLTAAAHTHERKLELELEEAWFQTRTLPAGLQLRAGRFSSQLGYLNEQHPHTDDFVERPLLYRAFLGGHWYDDGLRLNWVLPTGLYVRLGAEVFRGKRLVEEAARAGRPGAAVLSAKVGGDFSASQSWQAGISLLHNRRQAALESEHGHAGEHESEEGGDGHGVAFTGRRMWLGDVAWKWAPNGNNSQEQVRVVYERALIRGLNAPATRGDRHVGSYLSVVWRFRPAWELGARTDMLKVRIPHDDHVDTSRPHEQALMLAYKPTHQQTFRLQVTRERNRVGDEKAQHAVQLQYILNFGAHAGHAF